MSAIFGLFDSEGVSESTLHPPLQACAAYGSDGCSLWIDGPIGLGHRLSHFTPESYGENQPYPSDGLTITADTRIDNRAELLKLLAVANPSLPDSQLILRAYQRWGMECTTHLIGDFAFALWDSRRQTLFCARDHVGARPFYYYAPSPRFFAFATSIDSLLAFPKVPTMIDEERVAIYLFNPLEVSIRRTFFTGIFKLPFGHQICVSTQGIQENRHWQPRQQPIIRYRHPEEYAELVRERVSEAVACRLRTPLAAGAHISGGLDSSSVAVMAQRQLQHQGLGLTMGYSWSPPKSDEDPPRSGKDERDLIERLACQEGIPLHFASNTSDEQYAYQRIDIARTPIATHSTEISVLRDAQQHGIRTILSGWGGDEGITFNGRGYLAWLFMSGRWRTLQKFIGRGGKNPKGWARRLFKHVVLPALPDSLFMRYVAHSSAGIPPSLIHPQLLARLDQSERLRHMAVARDRTDAFSTQAALFNHGHLTDRLDSWAIWGAAFGVTYSYPLLDRRVLEVAYALPPEAIMTLQGDRIIYRNAMRGILPEEIRTGNKVDPALEERARRLRLAAWQRLATEADNGHFDADIPWLDMSRFRTTLRNVPDSSSVDSIPRFVRLKNALYGWELWHRYHVLSKQHRNSASLPVIIESTPISQHILEG